jgi:ClpP class serine protease
MNHDALRAMADRLNLAPLLLSDVAARNLRLLRHARFEPDARGEPPAKQRVDGYGMDPRGCDRPYEVLDGGIALVTISGTLLANHDYSGPYYTGYESIETRMDAALEDPEVLGVALLIDSHGGEAAGCFETSDRIYRGRDSKPIWALAKHAALSGGYALASSADRLYGTPSARLGSIGVVVVHMDVSGALDQFGVAVTLLYSGDHKVDGNPFQPLPPAVRARIQADLDATRQTFAGAVARNRGLGIASVLATEAAVYRVEEAVTLGLADGVRDTDAFFAEFRAFLETQQTEQANRGFIAMSAAAPLQPSTTGVQPMTQQTKPGEAAPAVAQVTAQQDPAALAAARDEGVIAERARMAAILGSEEAKGRDEQAQFLATKTSVSVPEALGILAASPVARTGSPLDAAMAAGGPNVGGGTGDDPAPAQPLINSADIYARRAAVTKH